MVYSFVIMVPCADNEADLWEDNTLAHKLLDQSAAHIHEAIELKGRACPPNEIVQMTFVGFAETSETVDGQQVKVKRPRFAFSYSPVLFESVLKVHDRRDNTQGGFAFAEFHPGTNLPQQSWAE